MSPGTTSHAFFKLYKREKRTKRAFRHNWSRFENETQIQLAGTEVPSVDFIGQTVCYSTPLKNKIPFCVRGNPVRVGVTMATARADLGKASPRSHQTFTRRHQEGRPPRPPRRVCNTTTPQLPARTGRGKGRCADSLRRTGRATQGQVTTAAHLPM
jgi:hypothetical protein